MIMYQNIANSKYNFLIVIGFSKSKNTIGLIYPNLLFSDMKSNDNVILIKISIKLYIGKKFWQAKNIRIFPICNSWRTFEREEKRFLKRIPFCYLFTTQGGIKRQTRTDLSSKRRILKPWLYSSY